MTPEQLAEVADEINRLRDWKAGALDVLGRWSDFADEFIATATATELGRRKTDMVAERVAALRADADRWEAIARRLAARMFDNPGGVLDEHAAAYDREMKKGNE